MGHGPNKIRTDNQRYGIGAGGLGGQQHRVDMVHRISPAMGSSVGEASTRFDEYVAHDVEV